MLAPDGLRHHFHLMFSQGVGASASNVVQQSGYAECCSGAAN